MGQKAFPAISLLLSNATLYVLPSTDAPGNGYGLTVSGAGTLAWTQLASVAYVDSGLLGKANSSHTHAQSDITDLTTDLANKQPLDATLTAIAGVATAADQLIYATGSDTFAVTALTSFARSILDDANAATVRATLGLGSIATLATGDKQDTLVAGGNIKTINGVSPLGSGDLVVSGGIGGSTGATDNRVLRSDGTGGATAQASAIEIDDNGRISNPTGNLSIVVPTYGASPNYGELYFNNSALYQSYFHINATNPMSGGPDNFGLIYYNNNQLVFGFYSGARITFTGAGAQATMAGTWNFPASAVIPSPSLGASSNGGGDVRLVLSKTGNGVNQTLTGYAYCYAQTGIPPALDMRARSIQIGAYSDVSSSHVWNDTNITNKLLVESGSNGTTVTGNFNVTGGLSSVGTYTVGTLPSASSNAGKEAQVTDSSVTTYRSTVSGGGANRVKVFSDGTNWLVN